ncbi:MAG: hypothetical protein LCH91_00720 [Bacteroidetes bacterium]|nr:hypothetical protein [Bacteroidota bacterium]
MKKSFEIKAKKELNSFIRAGKFYAKNETAKVLNLGEADPLASCYKIVVNNDVESKLVLQ